MHESALKAGEDPDRLSFLHAVRVVQRKLYLCGAIPSSAEEEVLACIAKEKNIS